MASPFFYAKVKHQRRVTPPVYADYRRYKPHLREEFGGQCVYCRSLDAVKGKESFGVDHYRPKKHYPELSTEYLNLFYACNRCNSLKGDFWPSATQSANGAFVPNPCEHVMFQHLRYHGATVQAASAAGTWTIELLDLNDPDAVTFRGAFLQALRALHVQIEKSKGTVREINRKLRNPATAAETEESVKQLRRAEENIASLESALTTLLGSSQPSRI